MVEQRTNNIRLFIVLDRLSFKFGQPNRHLVNLRRQDEVILTQSSDKMRPYFHGHFLISFQPQVGMMPFPFGNLGNLVEKVDPRHEIPDGVVLPDPLTIVRQIPVPVIPSVSIVAVDTFPISVRAGEELV